MTIFLLVFPESEPNASIFLTTSMPSVMDPKTTCFPSNQDVFAVHIKNCDPLVLVPALAIDKIPGPIKKRTNWIVENTGMGEGEVFIGKFLAINALSTSAVMISKVTALAHKIWYHAMESRILKSETLLTRA